MTKKKKKMYFYREINFVTYMLYTIITKLHLKHLIIFGHPIYFLSKYTFFDLPGGLQYLFL